MAVKSKTSTITKKLNEESKQIIHASITANIPVMLVWETGTGKTTLVKEMAMEQNKTLIRLNLNGETGTDELLGKYILRQESGKSDSETIWIDWPMLKAIKEGHRLLLDEINAALPEVLLAIQSLAESNDWVLGNIMLPEKEGEVIIPHADFRLFATANPAGWAYWGTKDFNSATLSRFNVLYVNPLPQSIEKKLLISKFPKLDVNDIHFITDIGSRDQREILQRRNILFLFYKRSSNGSIINTSRVRYGVFNQNSYSK